METRISAEDWKSTEMIRAENDLYDAIDRAGKEITAADERLAAIEAEKPAVGIEALTTYASGPDAPGALRAAIEDVRNGRRSREEALADPAITADPVLLAALEAITRPDDTTTRWPHRRRAGHETGYDPDDFSTHTIMRGP